MAWMRQFTGKHALTWMRSKNPCVAKGIKIKLRARCSLLRRAREMAAAFRDIRPSRLFQRRAIAQCRHGLSVPRGFRYPARRGGGEC
jgi:hypothetical protein